MPTRGALLGEVAAVVVLEIAPDASLPLDRLTAPRHPRSLLRRDPHQRRGIRSHGYNSPPGTTVPSCARRAVAPADPVGAPTATPRSTTPRGKTRHHPRPPAAPIPRTAATHWAAARHKAATPPHTTQPTTPTAPTPHSTGHHAESPATPETHTPTPPRPTDPTRDENPLPQQAGPPPRNSPPAPTHPAPPTPAPRPATSSPSHLRVCAATPTTPPQQPWGAPPARCPRAPLTLAGIVLPRLAAVKGEPVRGPLPRTEPSLRDRSAALDNHHPGQRAALYRVRGGPARPTPPSGMAQAWTSSGQRLHASSASTPICPSKSAGDADRSSGYSTIGISVLRTRRVTGPCEPLAYTSQATGT